MGLLVAGSLSMLAAALLPNIDSDDMLYGVVAREMLASGDWLNLRPDARLVPRPPLTLWLDAISMRLGGDTSIALRFWHALLSVGLVLAVYRLARVDGSREEALLAALVYATAAQVFYHSLIPQQDVPLTLFLTLGFIEYLSYRQGRTRAALFAGMWVALGVLSKGIVAIAIFMAVVAVDALIAWRRGRLGHWRWSEVVAGALVFLAIAAPWFVAGVMKRGAPFVNLFFLKGDVGIGRFFSTRFGARHEYWKALISYVPVLAAGVLPWTGWLPGIVRQGWREFRAGPAAVAFCAVWAAVYFLGISVSPADKEIRYLLPLFPPLCVLAGRFLSSAAGDRGDLRWTGAIALVLGLTGLLATWQVRHALTGKDILIYGILLPGGATMFLTLVASGVTALRGHGRQAIAVAAAGTVIAYSLLEWRIAGRWEWMYPWRTIGAAFREHVQPGDRVMLAGDIMGESSFVFYYLGPEANPHNVFSYSFDDARFLRDWNRDGGVFALMAAESYARLRDRIQHQVLATMPSGWILVRKR